MADYLIANPLGTTAALGGAGKASTRHPDSEAPLWETIALVSFGVYIVSQLLFRYSTFGMTYVLPPGLRLLDISECVVEVIALCAIALRGRKLNTWQTTATAALLSLGLVSFLQTRTSVVALGILLVIALANVELDRLFALYSAACIVGVAIISILTLTGLLWNREAIPNDRLVFSYGFTNPNVLGALLFSSLSALSLFCWERRTWAIPAVLSLFASLFAYVTLSSHTSSAVLACLSIAMLVGHAFKKSPRMALIKKAILWMAIGVPLALFVFTLAGAALYDGGENTLTWVDKALHMRLLFAHNYYLNNGGLTLMGREYSFVSSYHNGLAFAYLDCGYCQLGMVHGLLLSALLIVVYITAVARLRSNSRFFLIGIVVLLNAAYMVMEVHGIGLFANSSLMLLTAFFEENHTPKHPMANRLCSSHASHFPKSEKTALSSIKDVRHD